MTTESCELKFIDKKVLNQSYFFKIIERGRIVVEKMKDRRGRDFTEDDYALTRAFFYLYEMGIYQIFAQRLQAEEQSVTQAGLFDCQSVSDSSQNIDGTVVDNTTPNQNDKKDGTQE